MTPEEIRYLRKTFEKSSDLNFEFFKFQMQTKVQLALAQVQFSLTLGSIALAILAIGVGIDRIEVSIWSILSIIFSFVLLVWSVTLHREIVDDEDKGLLESDEKLSKDRNELIEKIVETFQKNDFSIFQAHINEKKKAINEPVRETHQVGEVAVFLLFSSIGFGTLAVISPQENWAVNVYLIAAVLFASFLLSFRNWSLLFVRILTRNTQPQKKTTNKVTHNQV